MKMSAQDIWKHITHLITLWEDPWSPQNCSKIPKWKMRAVSAWVSRVQWSLSSLLALSSFSSNSRSLKYCVLLFPVALPMWQHLVTEDCGGAGQPWMRQA